MPSDGRRTRWWQPFLSLDFDVAEQDLARSGPRPDEIEACFEVEWTRSLFSAALAALEARCKSEEEARPNRALPSCVIPSPSWTPRAEPSYATMAAEMGLSVADVTNHLAVQRAFREHVLDELRVITYGQGRVSGRSSCRARHRLMTFIDNRALENLRHFVLGLGPGDLVGDRYELRQRIGEGSMGVVTPPTIARPTRKSRSSSSADTATMMTLASHEVSALRRRAPIHGASPATSAATASTRTALRHLERLRGCNLAEQLARTARSAQRSRWAYASASSCRRSCGADQSS